MFVGFATNIRYALNQIHRTKPKLQAKAIKAWFRSAVDNANKDSLQFPKSKQRWSAVSKKRD